MRRSFLLFGSLSLVACEQNQDASSAAPYEACDSASVGDPCGEGPTVCTEGALQTFDGYCTQSCDVANDCVEVAGFAAPTCLQLYAGRHCALPCGDDEDCPNGNVCAGLTSFDGGTIFVCQPEGA